MKHPHVAKANRSEIIMEIDKQLSEWAKGNPVHNKERDECCPDFSCCNGNLASKETRERFAKAHYEGDEKTKYQMLGMFLGDAFSDKKVCVADGTLGGQIH